MDSINAVSCIKGEIHSIMTLMRLNTKWAKHKLYSREVISPEESLLVQSFRVLIEYLEGMFDIRDVDCVMYIQPFHQLIVSEHASGPLTIAATSALSKFALYGFLACGYPNAELGIHLISDCICRCVFEETDWESDEVVLLKLLELSTMALRCDASSHLTIKAAWNIYSTCISIHNQYRASKILKSEAATALRHLTLSIFSKAHGTLGSNDSSSTKSISNSKSRDIYTDQEDDTKEDRKTSWEDGAIKYKLNSPVGITLLCTKIMVVLSSLMDPSSATAKDSVKFALSLVNIALEAGGPALSTIDPLVDVLRGDVCRYLLRATQNEDLAVFSLSLRVVFNMFMSIKDHMKIQLEVFLTSVHLRLLQINNNSVSFIPAREELALESLLEFCREPALMHDLYTNYDCDVQCTNLFDSIISTLCARAVPIGLQLTLIGDQINTSPSKSDKDLAESMSVNTLNSLALYGVLSVLHAVSGRVIKNEGNTTSDLSGSGFTSGLLKPIAQRAMMKPELNSAIDAPEQNMKNIISTSTSTSNDSLEEQVDRWCMTEELSSNTNSSTISPEKDSFKLTHIPLVSSLNSTSQFEDKSDVEDELGYSDHGQYDQTVSNVSTPSKDIDSDINDAGTLERGTSTNSEASSSSPIIMSRLQGDRDGDDGDMARVRTADTLRKRKMRKQRLKMAAEKFNDKPLKMDWILFSVELGLLPKTVPTSAAEDGKALTKGNSSSSSSSSSSLASSEDAGISASTSAVISSPIFQSDAKAVAKFLKLTPGLDKSAMGEYIGKGPVDQYPFISKVLEEYCNSFDFEGNPTIDQALRIFLGHFKLPGEAQCIDRIMEAFAIRLFTVLGPGKPFKTKDCAFILAFSTILLNTDLHNPTMQEKKRMKKAEFIRNNRGINDNEDLPVEYLENLYDNIKERQIQVDFDINDHMLDVDYSETSTWDALLRRSAADQAPAAFTPTVTARQLLRQAGVLQPSVHDRDMFIVMAKPVLRTVFMVWDPTDDGKLIFRMLEGILDYASACVHFEMKDLLDMLLRVLVQRIKSNVLVPQMVMHRGKQEPEQFAPIKLAIIEPFFGVEFETIISNRRLTQHETVSKPSPTSIFSISASVSKSSNSSSSSSSSSSYSSLSVSGNKADSNNVVPPPIHFAYTLRGELMLKTTLEVCSKYCDNFGKNSWDAFLDLVRWGRLHQVLPSSALKIDDFEMKSGDLLPLSSSAFRCSDLEKGRIPIDGETTQDEIDHYYSNASSKKNGLWGFFFDSVERADRYKPTFDENGCLVRYDKEFSLIRGNSITDGISTGAIPSSLSSTVEFQDEVKSRDMLVKLCMEKSNVMEVIMKRSSRFTDDVLRQFTISLVDSVQNAISNVTSVYAEATNNINVAQPIAYSRRDPARMLSPDQFSIVGRNELDGVLCLEYLSKLVMTNQSRAGSIIWPIVHECLCSVFDEKIDTLTIQTPYLAERFVVIILRASIYQCDMSQLNLNQSTTTSSSQVSAWASLRLLRGVHSESISNISLRLSSGLYHLVQAVIDCNTQIDLEQWYLVFSLLSAATTSFEGQQYVFDALNKLIESNFVNDVNFTPCRHLLMRFLHRAFPVNIDSKTDTNNQSTTPRKEQIRGEDTHNSKNPWEGLALTCLLRLTLMALGGYTNALSSLNTTDTKNIDVKNAHVNIKSSTSMGPKKYITFPLPVEGNADGTQFTSMESSSSSSFLSSAGSISSSADVKSPSTIDILKKNVTQISVTCVGFSKIEEVELLWIEASKIYSDVINCEPLSTSRQAIFLLQTNLMSGSIVKLPNDCWIKCIDEMFNRLPLDVKGMHKKFVNHSGNTVEDICDICLRCCNLMFEVMVSQFRQLLAYKEFGVQWLNFMTILGVNVSSVNKRLHIHEETVEMIAALLRLLRPIPVATVAVEESSHIVATTTTPSSASTPANETSTSNKTMGSTTLPETISFESFEEDTLLRDSWKLLTQINSNISILLSAKHPKIVADLTALTKSPLPKPSSREKITDKEDNSNLTSFAVGDNRGEDKDRGGDVSAVSSNSNTGSEKRGSGLFSALFG